MLRCTNGRPFFSGKYHFETILKFGSGMRSPFSIGSLQRLILLKRRVTSPTPAT